MLQIPDLVVRTCEVACRDLEIDACGDEATVCLDDCLLTVSGRTEDCGRCLAEQSFSTVEGGGGDVYCGYRIADPTDGTCDDFCSP